jgi:threonine synthase
LIYAKDGSSFLDVYFDYLPLEKRENIISEGEGLIPVEDCHILTELTQRAGIKNTKVYVYRNDKNPGTGTFKDVAAAMAASVLKENGIKKYCVASTGNIATAFAYYLSKAGISLSVFIPQDALKANEAEVSVYGQRVFRVKGDYAKAKQLAAEYSKKYGILMSGGNVDPARVEAKKTMVFEWLRQMEKFPTVYVQALSGGTGPIAIDKALEDIAELNLVKQYPRYIMVQPGNCDPMTQAWEKAKANNFPEGWENDYPVLENPKTAVPTLATGNPATYPVISSLVKKSGGEIISFNEDEIYDIARLVAYETGVRVGPASTIALGGFLESLRKGLIKDNDVVLINIGEGVRRAPEFKEQLIYTTKEVSSIEECDEFDRETLREKLWQKFEKYYTKS